MGSTQYQLLKDSKVTDQVQRDLMNSTPLSPEQFLGKKRAGEDLFEHDKTVLRKPKKSVTKS